MADTDVQLVRNGRFWASRLLVVAAAMAIGIALQAPLTRHLEALQALAATDPLRARAELAQIFRFPMLGLFGATGGLGVHLVLASRRALRLGVFPPPGRSFGGTPRRFEGDAARRVAAFMLVLAVLLIAASLAGAWVSWQIAERLIACRAQ
jgi:hypothetical protein